VCDQATHERFDEQSKDLQGVKGHLVGIDSTLATLRSVQASISEDVNSNAEDAREKIANLNAKMDNVVGDISSIRIEQAKPLLTMWQKLILVSCIPAALLPVYETMFTAKQLQAEFSKHVEKDMSEHKANAKDINILDKRIIVLEQK